MAIERYFRGRPPVRQATPPSAGADQYASELKRDVATVPARAGLRVANARRYVLGIFPAIEATPPHQEPRQPVRERVRRIHDRVGLQRDETQGRIAVPGRRLRVLAIGLMPNRRAPF